MHHFSFIPYQRNLGNRHTFLGQQSSCGHLPKLSISNKYKVLCRQRPQATFIIGHRKWSWTNLLKLSNFLNLWNTVIKCKLKHQKENPSICNDYYINNSELNILCLQTSHTLMQWKLKQTDNEVSGSKIGIGWDIKGLITNIAKYERSVVATCNCINNMATVNLDCSTKTTKF